jgi:HNH endonuclease
MTPRQLRSRERASQMALLYKTGIVFSEIGRRFSISRQAVQQLTARYLGLTSTDGGRQKRKMQRLESALERVAQGTAPTVFRIHLSDVPEQIAVQRRHALAIKREARFWERVEKHGPLECWPWLGPIRPSGYGACFLRVPFGGGYAHRCAFFFSTGRLIPRMVIMHTCDNPPCCNPAHLRQTTFKENVRDSMRKGRRPSRERLRWG